MELGLDSLELTSVSGASKIDFQNCFVIGIYFSAHWCPPSRMFTPKLISFYNILNEASKKLEIIFVSLDRDVNCWESYYEEMPWLSIPFTNERERYALAKKLQIPDPSFNLTIVTSTGQLITEKGIEDLKSKGAEAYELWIAASNQVSRFLSAPFCNNGHLMSYAVASEKKTCSSCASEIVVGWDCSHCTISICHLCQEWICTSSPAESPRLLCLKMHNLRKTSRLEEYYMKRFLISGFTCRTCNELLDGEMYHCRNCIYDICLKCSEAIEYIGTQGSRRCEKSHGIDWHPDICTIIQQKYKAYEFRCEDCGGNFKGGGAYCCLDCEFYICVMCQLKKFASSA